MTAASKRKDYTSIHYYMMQLWLETAITQYDLYPNNRDLEERPLVWLDECLAYWREQ